MTKRNTIIIVSSVLFLVLLDQITKILIINNVQLYEDINVINNFLVITHSKNTGIAYGMLDGSMWLLYIISVLAAGLFYFLLKDFNLETNKLYSIAVLLMISGGIGNFIDRVLFQEVTDFISLIFFGKALFGVFNVADMCLVIGMIIFVVDIIIEDVLKWKKSP